MCKTFNPIPYLPGLTAFWGILVSEIPFLIYQELSKTVFQIFLTQLGLDLEGGLLSKDYQNCLYISHQVVTILLGILVNDPNIYFLAHKIHAL